MKTKLSISLIVSLIFMGIINIINYVSYISTHKLLIALSSYGGEINSYYGPGLSLDIYYPLTDNSAIGTTEHLFFNWSMFFLAFIILFAISFVIINFIYNVIIIKNKIKEL